MRLSGGIDIVLKCGVRKATAIVVSQNVIAIAGDTIFTEWLAGREGLYSSLFEALLDPAEKGLGSETSVSPDPIELAEFGIP